jgi:ubiquinone/menaquinone biosynthesis C-methylase UbiE
VKTPWWRTHFDDRYFELHYPLFTEARSRAETAGIRELLGLHCDARILDAPCGWGRHTVLLAEAGLDAFGADLSVDLLRHAPRTVPGYATPATADNDTDDRPHRPHYTAADIRALPFANASFDAVINVFTSLGLFLNDDDDIAALREARRVLRPHGALLLESMHRDDIAAHYAEYDRWTLPDGTRVRVKRRFDPITGTSHEHLHWRRGNEHGQLQHTLRLRTATEIDTLLRTAGFGRIDYYGSWHGHPFRHDHHSLIAIAR